MSNTAFPAVFCDSAAALQAARADGLATNTQVLTVSPFIPHAASGRFTFLPDRLSKRSMTGILSMRRALQTDAYERAMADEQTSEYAHLAALIALQSLDLVILASFLEEKDFAEPRLILQVETGNEEAHSRFNGPWDKFLAYNSDCVVQRCKIEDFRSVNWAEVPHHSLLERLRLAGPYRVLYGLVRKTGARMPAFTGVRPNIIVLDENELVQETATVLALKGCSITALPSSTGRAQLAPGCEEKLRDQCREVFSKRVAGVVTCSALKPLLQAIGDRLIEQACIQAKARQHYSRHLKADEARKRVVISNFPAKASLLAMRNLCRERGIPFIGFQHSVSAEICDDHESTFSTYEAWGCDLAFVYNRGAVRISKSLPGVRGFAVPVGMPGDFRRTRGGQRQKCDNAEILCISTAVYAGYTSKIRYGTQTDSQMLELEMRMQKDVLGMLPHKVMYKCYPTRRFADLDPVIPLAKSFDNITCYTDFLDMRYLIRDARILVTGRATSTVSWCVMSGKPLVFLDVVTNMPLRPEVRAAFEAGTFLFSTAEKDWASRLREFLSQPLSEIEKLWLEKSDGHRALVSNFMDMGEGAARRSADHILSCVRVQAVPEMMTEEHLEA